MTDQTEVKLPPIASAAPIADGEQKQSEFPSLNAVSSDKVTIMEEPLAETAKVDEADKTQELET